MLLISAPVPLGRQTRPPLPLRYHPRIPIAEQGMRYLKAMTLAAALCGCAPGNQPPPTDERMQAIAADPQALAIWGKSVRDCRAGDEKACRQMEVLRRCFNLPVDEAVPPAACIRASRFE